MKYAKPLTHAALLAAMILAAPYSDAGIDTTAPKLIEASKVSPLVTASYVAGIRDTLALTMAATNQAKRGECVIDIDAEKLVELYAQESPEDYDADQHAVVTIIEAAAVICPTASFN